MDRHLKSERSIEVKLEQPQRLQRDDVTRPTECCLLIGSPQTRVSLLERRRLRSLSLPAPPPSTAAMFPILRAGLAVCLHAYIHHFGNWLILCILSLAACGSPAAGPSRATHPESEALSFYHAHVLVPLRRGPLRSCFLRAT